jgi:hypothetical protein
VTTPDLLAYSTDTVLGNPQELTDQTIWQLTSSDHGRITGKSIAIIANTDGQKTPPSNQDMTGYVGPGGQVRIDFSNPDSTSRTGITGVGQMRWMNGGWTFEMQMAAPNSSSVVTHWAYMVQLQSGDIPPESDGTSTQGNPLADVWSWLDNTTWNLTDTTLTAEGVPGQSFTISLFKGGYFWGQGKDSIPFTVLGSVTPEGNLLLTHCYNNGELVQRTGWLIGTPSGAKMIFRSYEGESGVGEAVLNA